MEDRALVIVATWDPEARVYVATSEDVPGLVAEAETVEALIEALRTIVPELLRENAALVKRPPTAPVIEVRLENIRLAS